MKRTLFSVLALIALVFSLAGILCEVVTLVSVLIGIVRFDILKQV